MSRLTEKAFGCFKYDLKDYEHKVGEFNDYDAFFVYHMAIKKLGEYEDLEEQGRLIKLPCKVGDTIYIVEQKYRGGKEEYWINIGKFRLKDFIDMGVNKFTAKEEAEAKLKDLRERDEK